MRCKTPARQNPPPPRQSGAGAELPGGVGMTCSRRKFVGKSGASNRAGVLCGRWQMGDGGWFKFRFKLKRELEGLN